MIHRVVDKWRRTMVVARMGRRFVDRVYIAAWLLWVPFRRRLGAEDKPVEFALRSHGRLFTVYVNGSHEEYLILEEILGREEYRIGVQDPAVIFDVGGNIGLAALYFALVYPNARVHTFEPNPDLFHRLVQNVAQFPNITAHECALGGSEGEVTFYLDTDKSIASSVVQRETTNRPVQVKMQTLNSVMRELGLDTVDLLKFDIEGAEYEMFAACRDVRVVHALVGEVHEDLMGHDVEAFLALLRPVFDPKIVPCGKESRYIVTACQSAYGKV